MDERVEPGKTEIGNVRRHIARYNLALALCDDKEVLDAACGEGYGSYLISKVASMCVGVDISPLTIINARKNYSKRVNLLYLQGDLNKISDGDICTYDTIVCFETIEHLDPDNEFCKKIRLNAKDGCNIIYSVPLDEKPGWNPHHKQVFNLNTAREIFDLKFVDEFVQVGLNFYRMGEELPEGKRFYIGIRMV